MGVAYQESAGTDITFVFDAVPEPGALPYRVDVAFDGALTLQDVLDTINASALTYADGTPVRVAANGPNQGQILALDDADSDWNYLFALEARLENGRLVIGTSAAAALAGITGGFALVPGMQLALGEDGQGTELTLD